jgi:hypothetical protein
LSTSAHPGDEKAFKIALESTSSAADGPTSTAAKRINSAAYLRYVSASSGSITDHITPPLGFYRHGYAASIDITWSTTREQRRWIPMPSGRVNRLSSDWCSTDRPTGELTRLYAFKARRRWRGSHWHRIRGRQPASAA